MSPGIVERDMQFLNTPPNIVARLQSKNNLDGISVIEEHPENVEPNVDASKHPLNKLAGIFFRLMQLAKASWKLLTKANEFAALPAIY